MPLGLRLFIGTELRFLNDFASRAETEDEVQSQLESALSHTPLPNTIKNFLVGHMTVFFQGQYDLPAVVCFMR